MKKAKSLCLNAIIGVFCLQNLSAQTVKELYNVGLPGISPKTLVTVVFINGKGYVGGDIEVGDEQTLLSNDLFVRNNLNMQFAPLALNRVRWDRSVIPVAISGFSNAQINSIVQALNEMTDRTNMSFVKRSTEQLDYVEIINDPNLGFNGGSSNVGKRGGQQFLRLNMALISESVVIHEMVHALAFYHEQSRSDRGTYVEILESNIISEVIRRRNFDILPGASTAFPYDCASIMHYKSTAFGKLNPNGPGQMITIRPRPGVSCNPMGGDALSPTDIQAINTAYPVETSNTHLNAVDFLVSSPTITEAWIVKNGVMIHGSVWSCSTCSSKDPEQYQLNITGTRLEGWKLDNPSYVKASSIISSNDQFLKINILFKYNASVSGVTVNTLRLKKGFEFINIPISTPFIVLD